MQRTEIFSEGQRAVIINQLNKAKSVVLVAMAYFTDARLFNLLMKKAQEGVKVHLIVRDDDINTTSGIEYEALKAAGGDFCYNKNIHHKFCVIDGVTVLSGSYNWTYQASRNHEDLTLIQGDIQVAAELMNQFFKIKDPLRNIRRASLQDKNWRSESDSEREARRSGIIKKLNERRNRNSSK